MPPPPPRRLWSADPLRRGRHDRRRCRQAADDADSFDRLARGRRYVIALKGVVASSAIESCWRGRRLVRLALRGDWIGQVAETPEASLCDHRLDSNQLTRGKIVAIA